jgi:integrase-like protein
LSEAAKPNSLLEAMPDDPKPAAKPKLLDQVRNAIRRKHYSLRREETYVHWIKRFIDFSGKRHPAGLGEREVTAFLADNGGSEGLLLRYEITLRLAPGGHVALNLSGMFVEMSCVSAEPVIRGIAAFRLVLHMALPGLGRKPLDEGGGIRADGFDRVERKVERVVVVIEHRRPNGGVVSLKGQVFFGSEIPDA